MKFFTSLLTILVATTAYASTNKQTKNVDIDLTKVKLGDFGLEDNEACNKALDAYEDCLSTTILEDSNKDKNCEIIKSEKCQNFFKNGIKSVKGCENINEFKLKLENIYLKTTLYSLNMECAKDENGKYCPLSSISTQITARAKNKQNQQVSDDEFKSVYTDSVMNTCSSKACINAAIEFQSGNKEIKKDYEDFKNALMDLKNLTGNKANANNIPVIKSANTTTTATKTKRSFNFNNIDLNSEEGVNQLIDATADYLKSEECTNQGGNLSSNATTLKYSVALIITLALFLFQLA